MSWFEKTDGLVGQGADGRMNFFGMSWKPDFGHRTTWEPPGAASRGGSPAGGRSPAFAGLASESPGRGGGGSGPSTALGGSSGIQDDDETFGSFGDGGEDMLADDSPGGGGGMTQVLVCECCFHTFDVPDEQAGGRYLCATCSAQTPQPAAGSARSRRPREEDEEEQHSDEEDGGVGEGGEPAAVPGGGNKERPKKKSRRSAVKLFEGEVLVKRSSQTKLVDINVRPRSGMLQQALKGQLRR